MKTQSIDTHPEVEKIQISLLRKESTAQKFSRVRSLSNTALQLSRRAVARANKNRSPIGVSLSQMNSSTTRFSAVFNV